jgi:tRNA-dihydrouridine synthase A
MYCKSVSMFGLPRKAVLDASFGVSKCVPSSSSRHSRLFATTSASTSIKEVFTDRFSVAPMMDYTDRCQRKLQRLLSRKAVLYTEMITAMAITNTKNLDRFLETNINDEEPLVLQLGGSDPKQMKEAVRIAYQQYGYRQFNINAGCPSDTVANAGCFGARLMYSPQLVSELALACSEITGSPTSIKCRIGVDEHDSYDFLTHFIDHITTHGKVNHVIVHARKAILNMNLSPKQNRQIPPLIYDRVYQLKRDFPHVFITINGGITSYEACQEHLAQGLDGCMIGRAVIGSPFYWNRVDSLLYNTTDPGILSIITLLSCCNS